MQPISKTMMTAAVLLALLCAMNSFAATTATNGIALVQSGSAEGSGVASVSKAFASSNTAGNLIIAFVRASTTTQTVTLSDTAGNSYTDAVWQQQTKDGHQIHLFYAANIKGGANTVKASFSGSNNHPWLAIYEYSGLSAATPLDKTAAAQGNSAAASSGATAATTSANELVFTGLGLPSGSSAVATAGAGYSVEQQDTNAGGSRATTADQEISAAGAYAGTFTLSASANWSAVVATFAAGTSTPPASAPTISTASLPSGTQNAAYSAVVQASGGTTPYTWSVSSGSLPVGLQLNSSTGAITGTPTTAGASSFTVQLVDASSNRASQTLSLTINAAPAPPSSGGSISLVQSGAGEGSSVASVSKAFASPNTAGNLLIVFVRMSTTTQTVTVSDTAGNSYSQAVSQVQSSDGHQIHLFYAANIQGGANSVSAAFSGTNSHPWLAIYEYSGLSATNPLDKTAAAQGSSNAPSSGATAATSSANELVFSGVGLPSSTSITVTAGSAYVLAQQDAKSGGSRAATEGAMVSTAGAYTGNFTLSAGTTWSAVVASFSATGSPAPISSVSVSISPTSATLQTQATQQFSATVSGSSNTAVTWLVNGIASGNSTVGTISSTGLYQAPAAVPSSSVTVTAQSVADTTKSASASITVVAAPSPVAVSISPTSASVQSGQSQQFSATVTGCSNTTATWQVNGIAGGNSSVGTISAGMYQAPSTTSNMNVTVTAVSYYDSTKSASAAVAITGTGSQGGGGTGGGGGTEATGAYGAGFGDDLTNGPLCSPTSPGGTCSGSPIDGYTAADVSFLNLTSSTLQSVQIYIQEHPGYAGGNGGSWLIQLQSDDGSSNHYPTGTVLASITTSNFGYSSGDCPSSHPEGTIACNWPTFTFSNPPALTAGSYYHLVITNADSNPNTNFTSIDWIGRSDAPGQPRFGSTVANWQGHVSSSAMSSGGTFTWSQKNFGDYATPVVALNFANGQSFGFDYMESEINTSPKDISSTPVRENFKPSTAVTVTGVQFRGKGSGTITASLYAGSTLLESLTLNNPGGSGAHVASANFASPHALSVGQQYYIQFSASGSFTTWILRDGSVQYGFPSTSGFGDGWAEYQSGSSWSDWSAGVSHDGDLQFVFTTQ
jgi:methionine-rich copper-binding protein CopC